jgi:ABC-type nitrate/sulfonate/bicarbonate transport system substrate-binding protein
MRRNIVLILFTLIAALSCNSNRDVNNEAIPLALGMGGPLYSGLIVIAEEKGYFKDSGLDLTINRYQSGLQATEALLRNEVDLSTAATLVFVAKLPEHDDLRIFATIATADVNEIVARKDRGIASPQDLKGKRIGVTNHTTSAYFATTFLEVNAIPPSEVELVDIKPAQLAEALAQGEVDAIATWDIYVYEAKQKLGDNAVSWQAQNMQDYHWLILGKEQLARHTEAIKRFLTALKKAEAFVRNDSEKARKIIMKKGEFDSQFMDQYWGEVKLRVSLGQSLVLAFEDEYRWSRQLQGQPAEEPNILNYIDAEALEEVSPETVTLIR